MDNEYFQPTEWDDYIGQPKLKLQLDISIKSALQRGVMLDHLLLTGPPGCGKTTLSKIIANQLHQDFISLIMPLKPNTLKQLILSFSGVVLFDELHRCSPRQQEEFLPLIEDGYLQLSNGSRLFADKLTIVAATTEMDKIIQPLWDRFVLKPLFEPYTDQELAEIVMGMAIDLGIEMDNDTATKLGRASGGVPRNAKTLVAMMRDIYASSGWLHLPPACEVLSACRMTEDGLREDHLNYLRILNSCGGVAGLEILGTHLQLPKTVIINMERLLVKRNLITFSKSGRELMPEGYSVIQKLAKLEEG